MTKKYVNIQLEETDLDLATKRAKAQRMSRKQILELILEKELRNIPYGQFGNRPVNCEDPDNPKHVCYKDCL